MLPFIHKVLYLIKKISMHIWKQDDINMKEITENRNRSTRTPNNEGLKHKL